MNNHDELLIKLFWNYEKQHTNSNYRRFNQRIRYGKYQCIKNYLEYRFNDSLSIIESLYRIIYEIYERPKCPICGKDVIFIGKPNSKGIFKTYCSNQCANKANKDKANKTKINRYGSVNNNAKCKQTKLERYGNENYNGNRKLAVQHTDYIKRNELLNKTKLERYGDKFYSNWDKSKQTKLERYGEYFVNIEKIKQTKLERYGCENYNGDRVIANSKIDWEESVYKAKQTKLNLYGDETYNNSEKNKQTCLERYGSTTWGSSEEGRKILSKIISSTEVQQKRYETCKTNSSFNISKPEEECYNLLIKKFNDTIRQYRDKRYPFNCDFYIPSKDLFIEFNGSHYHHGRPYLGTEEDIKEAEELLERDIILCKERGCNHTQYKNMWHCWTIRDPKKFQIAKENNLNYLVFYNFDEFKEWYDKS